MEPKWSKIFSIFLLCSTLHLLQNDAQARNTKNPNKGWTAKNVATKGRQPPANNVKNNYANSTQAKRQPINSNNAYGPFPKQNKNVPQPKQGSKTNSARTGTSPPNPKNTNKGSRGKSSGTNKKETMPNRGLKLKPTMRIGDYTQRLWRDCENPFTDVTYHLTLHDWFTTPTGPQSYSSGISTDGFDNRMKLSKLDETYFTGLHSKWYFLKVGILENNSPQQHYRIYHRAEDMVFSRFDDPRFPYEDNIPGALLEDESTSANSQNRTAFDYYMKKDNVDESNSQFFHCSIKNRLSKEVLGWQIFTKKNPRPAFYHGRLVHYPDNASYANNNLTNWSFRASRCNPLYQVAYQILNVPYVPYVNFKSPKIFDDAHSLQLVYNSIYKHYELKYQRRTLNDSDKWYIYLAPDDTDPQKKLTPSYRIKSRLNASLELKFESGARASCGFKLDEEGQGDRFYISEEKFFTNSSYPNVFCSVKPATKDHKREFLTNWTLWENWVLVPVDTDPWLVYNYIIADYKGHFMTSAGSGATVLMMPQRLFAGPEKQLFCFLPGPNRGVFYLENKQDDGSIVFNDTSNLLTTWKRGRGIDKKLELRFFLMQYSYKPDYNCYAITKQHPTNGRRMVMYSGSQMGEPWDRGFSNISFEFDTFDYAYQPKHCFMLVPAEVRKAFTFDAPRLGYPLKESEYQYQLNFDTMTRIGEIFRNTNLTKMEKNSDPLGRGYIAAYFEKQTRNAHKISR